MEIFVRKFIAWYVGLDGIYAADHQPLVFRRTKAPTAEALDQLVQTISQRIGRYLQRLGLLVRDIDNSHLQLEALALLAKIENEMGLPTVDPFRQGADRLVDAL